MAVPNYVSRSIALFGGKLTSVFDSAANDGAGIDYGASFTSFGVGNSVDGHDSGDGTTTHVYSTTIAVAPAATITIAAGVVVAVSGGQASPAVSGGSLSISGIVSAVLDEAALTLTITLNEASNIDDPSQIYIKTTSGTEYQSQVLLSGSDTTTLVFSVIEQVSGSALPETMSMSASVLLRTSDSLANISISNYPITETPAASSSGTFRNRVLPCIQAAQLNTRTKP